MKKESEHVALARKYRPQVFDEVLGQPSVSVTLKNALASGRLHHAYLFTGPRGVGKTTMARILAKALNCEKGPTPLPCGTCDACREIAASRCLDVLEMDAASHTGVDNVRQVIIDTVSLAPSRDRYKVFIIDEAHMLSTQAFNALLKTIEEPPPHVVFILATTEAVKIPATIASRCQRFRFRPVPAELLARHLVLLAGKEGLHVEPGALELLSRSAEGSLRDAVSLLDQCGSAGGEAVTEALVRDLFGFVPQDMLLGVLKAILAKDERGLAGWIPALYAEGIEPAQLLRDLRSACEVLYLQALGLETTADPGLRLLEGSAEQFSFLLRRLDKALGELRFGDSPRLTLELGLFDCLGSAADLGAWVKRLEELERRLGPDSPKASRGEGEGKAVPPASRPAADVAHPQGGEEPDGAAAQAWQSAIAALREEKAALAATLEQARLAVVRGAWTVTFARPFDRDSAERGRALIEAKLASTWGKSVHLEFFVGQNGHRPADELVDPVVTSSPAAQAGTWKDAAEASPAVEPPAGFSKAQHVLGGKVRIVKKPAP